MPGIQHGTAAFRRINLALFLGGFVTFASLYAPQPLMPVFSHEFGISPATASLSLSLATITLAVAMVVIGSLSEAWGRKPVMTASLLGASILAIGTAFSPGFHFLLTLRALQGVAMAGLPAIAMAYLSEEVDSRSLGLAMGLYISGNSVGGMAGRVITGMLTDYFSWRVALGGLGLLCLLASLLFAAYLRPSANFKPRPLALGALTRSLVQHLQDRGLLALYGVGFLVMGSFVTLFNYIGYQLTEPPYSMSQTVVGWIFLVYLVGTFSSTWMGRLADRQGRAGALALGVGIMLAGAVLTLPANLYLKLAGVAVFTFGFFGSHSIASAWVGARARHDKAQASSLYLLFYYVGSSLGGTAGGLFWSRYGWSGVVGMILVLLALALLLARRMPALSQSSSSQQAAD